MKKIIAVFLSALIFAAVFSGCGSKFSNLIKITPVTTTIASTSTEQPGITTSPEDIQTPSQEAATSLPGTEDGTSSTTNATTKPVQTTAKPTQTTAKPTQTTAKPGIQPGGAYTTKDDVSLYIHTYGKLPNNFITKSQAQALGWLSGSLESYAPGKCIGGDYFGNYENLLPKASGRKYYECDIDSLRASSRGAKRLVYSNDGLIYYTANHYESFTKLY